MTKVLVAVCTVLWSAGLVLFFSPGKRGARYGYDKAKADLVFGQAGSLASEESKIR